MNKLTMRTQDIVTDNIQKIAQLFPSCITETLDHKGKPCKKIDFDALRQLLSHDLVSDKELRYEFTWPDKNKTIHAAQEQIAATLRPCREESVDFDNTHNLYIEGDNLNVLQCLRETYTNKIKMIYIDPPYNTGNDFVYCDDFAEDREDYKQRSAQFDEQGRRLFTNTETNGRFHTDWLNMIYPRLLLAKDLLTEDGVIFISIDDHEVANLKKICDEIFGEKNFLAQLVWERAFAPKNDAKYISNSHDYILMYGRNIEQFNIGRLPRTAEADARYSNPDNDPRGVWQSDNLTVKTYTADCDYPIKTPSGRIVEPPAGRCWRLSAKAFAERLADNRIWFGADGNGVPRIKRFLNELKFEGMAPTSILFYKEVGHSQEGSQEVIKLFDNKGVFDGPKPVRLLERLITLANLQDDSIVMDFFSGSASTAHAVLKRNAEKETHCKFILIQLPENVSKNKKEQGYHNICEIGKERIRRAGAKIKADNPLTTQDLDTGFRVLKLDSTNMQDVYYEPQAVKQTDLFAQVDNIKPDRTPEDLLFQVMLELGATLDNKIETITINNKTIYNVADGYLIACFDKHIDETLITNIAKLQPTHAAFRDSSYNDDSTAINIEQLFRTYSPTTNLHTL